MKSFFLFAITLGIFSTSNVRADICEAMTLDIATEAASVLEAEYYRSASDDIEFYVKVFNKEENIFESYSLINVPNPESAGFKLYGQEYYSLTVIDDADFHNDLAYIYTSDGYNIGYLAGCVDEQTLKVAGLPKRI